MASFCICGNKLGETAGDYKMTSQPCKCDEPGPDNRRQRGVAHGIPSWVWKKQYEERKRHNLPLMTDIEKGVRARQV